MRGAALLVVASLVVAAVVVLARDPEEPWAVALLIASLGVATGAGAFAWQQRPRPTDQGRRAVWPRRTDALRRAVESGAIVVALLWLRAVDGLSLLTAIFVVAAFAVSELVLSARPVSPR
ncbi:MAG TPA: hypothetical protein VGK15_05760 [Candidatus Limnocylindria bacterium]